MDIINEYTLISDDNRKYVTHLHNQTIPIKRVAMEYLYIYIYITPVTPHLCRVPQARDVHVETVRLWCYTFVFF